MFFVVEAPSDHQTPRRSEVVCDSDTDWIGSNESAARAEEEISNAVQRQWTSAMGRSIGEGESRKDDSAIFQFWLHYSRCDPDCRYSNPASHIPILMNPREE